MTSRIKIVEYLNTLLRVPEIQDKSCNGLQVEGAARVRRVALVVDACLAATARPQRRGARMPVVRIRADLGGHQERQRQDRAARAVPGQT